MVTIGAVVVVVALVGFWFVKRTQMNETINSDRQLLLAKQSLAAGNEQLALADLKKVVDKYGEQAGRRRGGHAPRHDPDGERRLQERAWPR